MTSPYRYPSQFTDELPRVSWVVRAWRKVFGILVYTGPETCGHCKFWIPPATLRDYRFEDVGEPTKENGFIYQERRKVWYDCEGDCKLLFGEEDKTQHETCDRFQPKRRYKHRVRR